MDTLKKDIIREILAAQRLERDDDFESKRASVDKNPFERDSAYERGFKEATSIRLKGEEINLRWMRINESLQDAWGSLLKENEE